MGSLYHGSIANRKAKTDQFPWNRALNFFILKRDEKFANQR